MWRVRGASEAQRRANAQVVCAAFEALRGQVPGLERIELGIDESGVDYACDVVLVSEFSSHAALEAYARHPAHLQAKQRVGDLRVERFQVDYSAQ